MALFYFIRHGETQWNAEGRICGRSDVDLSEIGREQAQRLADRLKSVAIDAIYSSPLRRARQTAEIIAQATGLKPLVEEGLVELNYGSWEGKTFREIIERERETLAAWKADPGGMAPPGGETGIEVLNRVAGVMEGLARQHHRGKVALVCHKTVSRLAVCYALGVSATEYRRRLTMENAAVNIVERSRQCWRLVLFNDTSHLSGAEDGREEEF